MIKYTGYLCNIRFYNDENHYIVASIDVEEDNQLINMTGYMSDFNDYQKYIFYGDFVTHPKYGKQFSLDHYELALATDHDEIIKYLSSPLFKGVGVKQAQNIVDSLGENTLMKIKEDINVLDNVKGMTIQKKETIKKVLESNEENQEVIEFFMNHGVSLKNLGLIQGFYKDKVLQVLENNPYQMIEDIDGIGFKTCDELALKIGIDNDDPNRIKAAIIYAIKDYCFKNGSVYVSIEEIAKTFSRIIYQISKDSFYNYLEELIEDKTVIKQDDRYYYYQYYDSEQTIYSFIRRISSLKDEKQDIDIDKTINQFEKENSIKYAKKQRQAIETFLSSNFMILTGGPGTGKTTIVKAMIKIYHKLFPNERMAVLAPTGRAAKRLTELTGVKASTIHSLLQWDLHTNHFARDRNNPIEEEIIIIDEFSMVDCVLLAKLFEASNSVYKVLFIGDYHQLPSVSPGNVLHDLMQVDVQTIELNEIFRQAQDSGIIQLSHQIVNDEFNDFEIFNDYNDLNFFECNNTDVINNVCKIIKKAIDEGYDSNDIQVLAPMYQGIAGINQLNNAIQNLVNPFTISADTLRVGSKEFRVNDKILQLKNRPEDKVYNGDIGILIEVGHKDNFEYLEDTLVVDFDGNIIEYTAKDFNTITLAYCMSIHKSQGNEFKIVIMSVLKDYYIMLKRNLLYTAITRAKQSLFILGSKDAFMYGVKNTHDNKRRSSLAELFDSKDSPYDFM